MAELSLPRMRSPDLQPQALPPASVEEVLQ